MTFIPGELSHRQLKSFFALISKVARRQYHKFKQIEIYGDLDGNKHTFNKVCYPEYLNIIKTLIDKHNKADSMINIFADIQQEENVRTMTEEVLEKLYEIEYTRPREEQEMIADRMKIFEQTEEGIELEEIITAYGN